MLKIYCLLPHAAREAVHQTSPDKRADEPSVFAGVATEPDGETTRMELIRRWGVNPPTQGGAMTLGRSHPSLKKGHDNDAQQYDWPDGSDSGFLGRDPRRRRPDCDPEAGPCAWHRRSCRHRPRRVGGRHRPRRGREPVLLRLSGLRLLLSARSRLLWPGLLRLCPRSGTELLEPVLWSLLPLLSQRLDV